MQTTPYQHEGGITEVSYCPSEERMIGYYPFEGGEVSFSNVVSASGSLEGIFQD